MLFRSAYDLNKTATQLAREAVAEFKGDGRERFVLGSIGPGTKLPSLGHIDYDSLEQALVVQARGLLDGGVDAILIETCQDPLQIKAAVNGVKIARAELNRPDVPVFVQVTVETTGTLLVGADIAAAATVIHALDVPVIGLNCATGPQEMAEHVKWLAENWTGPISIQPNAGLPELVEGKTHYPLTPPELAKWLERFIAEDGINLVGGCCGTTPEHIRAVAAAVEGLEPRRPPVPEVRYSGFSGLELLTIRPESSFITIGERTNVTGSRRFASLITKGDFAAALDVALEQVRGGANILDVNIDRKSTRLNSSHMSESRMPSSA